MKSNSIIVVLLTLLLAHCDFQELTGYRYQTEARIERTLVEGRVRDSYTGEFLPEVLVSLENESDVSNDTGYFSMPYQLSDSDERNKPVALSFYHKNYYPKQLDIIVSTFANIYNTSLVRAAALIQDMTVYPDSSTLPIEGYGCRVKVFDYQGIATVTNVVLSVPFRLQNNEVSVQSFPMIQVEDIDPQSAIYQTKFRLRPDATSLVGTFDVYAADDEGYIGKQTFSGWQVQSDKPKF